MGQEHDLAAAVDHIAAETGFGGVVRVDIAGKTLVERAYGLADRAHGVPNTIDTRFAMASGSKVFTALAVMRLVADGVLALDTTARSLLGGDLPLIADDVTIEHLLAHRSGIGDYFDEEALDDITDYVMQLPVHLLDTTEAFVPALDGFPTVFPAGERFEYCNGGYVVLALLAERASGTPYHDLVQRTVIEPAGMRSTAYLRSDELPGDAAIGYLYPDAHPRRLRTNVLHLPVRGNGDGGAYTVAADVQAFWTALFAGRIVPLDLVAEMMRPHSDIPDDEMRYGLGFGLDADGTTEVFLIGGDPGVTYFTNHHPELQRTMTVICNDSDGMWPVMRHLRQVAG